MLRTTALLLLVVLGSTTPARADRVWLYNPGEPSKLELVKVQRARGRAKVATGSVFLATGLVVMLSLVVSGRVLLAQYPSDAAVEGVIFPAIGVALGSALIAVGARCSRWA